VSEMNQNKGVYLWSNQDKLLYFAILLPFLVAFIGAAYLLATVSIYLTVIFLLLYVMTSFFQAGCCIGCPYRGRFCPAVFGVYLANFLSAAIYKQRNFEPRFFRTNAMLAEISAIILFLFPIYWLILLNWYYVVIFAILMVVHVVAFFPVMCPNCSYHDTCPGGQVVLKLSGK
jgi:hypothetical protein